MHIAVPTFLCYNLAKRGLSKSFPRPQRRERPADVNTRAVMIGKIATGEIEDVTADEHAVASQCEFHRPFQISLHRVVQLRACAFGLARVHLN
jgi:hypothetical protein